MPSTSGAILVWSNTDGIDLYPATPGNQSVAGFMEGDGLSLLRDFASLTLVDLGRWRKQRQVDGEAAFPRRGKPHDEELAALKGQLARVRK